MYGGGASAVAAAVTMIATMVAVPVGDWAELGATVPAVTFTFSAVTTKLLSSRLYVNPLSPPADGVFCGLLMPQYACPVTVAVSDGKALDVPEASCWPPLATTDQVPPVLECRLSASISTNVVEIDAEKVTVTAADPVAVAVAVQISARVVEVLSVKPSARAQPVALPPDIPETVMLALPMNTETMTRSPIAAGLTVTLVTPPLLLSPPPTGNPDARLIVMGRYSTWVIVNAVTATVPPETSDSVFRFRSAELVPTLPIATIVVSSAFISAKYPAVPVARAADDVIEFAVAVTSRDPVAPDATPAPNAVADRASFASFVPVSAWFASPG